MLYDILPVVYQWDRNVQWFFSFLLAHARRGTVSSYSRVETSQGPAAHVNVDGSDQFAGESSYGSYLYLVQAVNRFVN